MNETIIGNEHILSAFSRAVREGRLASAYLLEGAPGSGKRTLSRRIAQMLVCEDADRAPCNACRDCENALSGAHPDIYYIEPEEGKEFISVEMIRRANAAAISSPIHASRRVFVIEHAAKLNSGAQNALLKNLEEPRSDAVYLLLSEDASALLATIRSRTVIYRTQLFSQEDVVRVLRERVGGASEEELEFAARLSGGAIGQGLSALGDKGLAACREQVAQYLLALASGADFDAFCAILKPDTKKEKLPLFYRVLLSGVRDALCQKAGVGGREFYCGQSEPEFRTRTSTLMGVMEMLCQLTDASMVNANSASAIFSLNSAAAKR